MSAEFQVILLGILLIAIGGALLLPQAQQGLLRVPRHKIAGILLTAIAMTWTCWSLYVHPVDFLAFLTPGKLVLIGLIVTPLICLFLDNLLCARALGGLMMLWPMPIILATRDFVTPWRLVPITLGYLSLTFGMVAVFHPWTVRILCERLSEHRTLRLISAAGFMLAGFLCLFATCTFGKVVGQ
jgi:hypothetical protein